MTKTCPYAASGCNFPEGECAGACTGEQPEALRLAKCLEIDCEMNWPDYDNQMMAAAELRRLQARLDATNKVANELAVALEKARRERDHWHARLLAEVNNRNTKEKT